jgi:hypothetical protein
MVDPSRRTTHARPSDRRRSVWRFSPHEITAALVFAVVAVWCTLVIVVPFRQPLLGGDFIVFYTFGTAARLGEWTVQYDWPAFHELQVSLVPTSASYFYPPSYPPLVPALYAPLSFLAFPTAYIVWTLLSTGIYCGLIALAVRGSTVSRTHALLVGLLFPPFIAHQALGHSTLWLLTGFVGGWWALTTSRPVVAGLIFSVVAIKPHLGMALAVVLLAMRLWRVVAGIMLGVALQACATVAICGTAAVAAYLDTTLTVLSDTRVINPADSRFTHGLRASLESAVPHSLATIGWLIASATFGWLMVRTWHRTEDWTLRISTLLLATLLISPHVQAYDAILLAPAALWLSCWAVSTRQPAVLATVLLLSAAFVVPVARLWGFPLTVPLMAWLLWQCQRVVKDRAEVLMLRVEPC